jgi:translocation and assembly module TamB
MSIDIESQAIVRDWEITLTLKGTLENLDLQLSSKSIKGGIPNLETDADILSMLIFGKTGKELSDGGTQSKTSAHELLAGILADTIGEELKEDTGLDIFDVETGAEDGKDVSNSEGASSDPSNTPNIPSTAPVAKKDEDAPSDRVKVTLGKHLSKRMTVKVALESDKGEMVQRAISEYQFLEHILVSGFRDTKGVYGGNLIFRIEFR